jgi:hypothetical protein
MTMTSPFWMIGAGGAVLAGYMARAALPPGDGGINVRQSGAADRHPSGRPSVLAAAVPAQIRRARDLECGGRPRNDGGGRHASLQSGETSGVTECRHWGRRCSKNSSSAIVRKRSDLRRRRGDPCRELSPSQELCLSTAHDYASLVRPTLFSR